MSTTEIIEILPLEVTAKGEILIESNLGMFRESVERFVAGINRNLTTDADFGQATQDVKTLQAMNDAIKAKKADVLAQAESIQALMAGLDDADQTIAKARLDLAKQIKAKADEIKAQIVTDGLAALVIAPRLRSRMKARFEEAIKGKRMLESMREAVMALAVEINQQALEIRDQVAEFRAEHGGDLLPDAEDLEIQSPEVVSTELRRRLEGKRHREEAERLKKEKEEAEAKAKEAAKQAAPAPTAAQDAPQLTPNRLDRESLTENPRQLTPAQEWDAYLCGVRVIAGNLKDLRLKLWHDQNIRAAKFFAGELREALDQASEMASGKEGA
jgi:hypothetical protein